jgi:hypothetical protein
MSNQQNQLDRDHNIEEDAIAPASLDIQVAALASERRSDFHLHFPRDAIPSLYVMNDHPLTLCSSSGMYGVTSTSSPDGGKAALAQELMDALKDKTPVETLVKEIYDMLQSRGNARVVLGTCSHNNATVYYREVSVVEVLPIDMVQINELCHPNLTVAEAKEHLALLISDDKGQIPTMSDLVFNIGRFSKQLLRSTVALNDISVIRRFVDNLSLFPTRDSEVERAINVAPSREDVHPLMFERRNVNGVITFIPHVRSMSYETAVDLLLKPLTDATINGIYLSLGGSDRRAVIKMGSDLIKLGLSHHQPINLLTILGFQLFCRRDTLGSIVRMLTYGVVLNEEPIFAFSSEMLSKIYSSSEAFYVDLTGHSHALDVQKSFTINKPRARVARKVVDIITRVAEVNLDGLFTE